MKTLRPYQQTGLKHLLAPLPSGKPHKALLICPGGGKTPIAAVGLKHLKAKSSLTLCLANILIKEHWKTHYMEWGDIPEDDIFIVESGNDTIPDTAKHIICNYELLPNENIFNQLIKRKYAVLVSDESQRLKNFSSLTSNLVLGGRSTGKKRLIDQCYFKWFLSGTLAPNSRPMEIFPLLLTCYPESIPEHLDFDAFGQYFCNGYVESFGGWNYNGVSNLKELSDKIKDFVYVVKQDDIREQLPDLIETNHYIPIELNIDETNTQMETLRKEVGLAKLPQVLDYLRTRIATKEEKLMVIAYNRIVIERLQEHLAQYNPRVVYGGCTNAEKKRYITEFIEDDSVRLILFQIKSGVSFDGIQYICNNIVSVQEDWCPGDWDQVIGRIRRFGQKYPVNFTRLIARNTLDTIQNAKVTSKRKVSEILFANTNIKELDMSLEENVKELNTSIQLLIKTLNDTTIPTPTTVEEAKPKNGKGKKVDSTDSTPVVAAKDSVPNDAPSSTQVKPAQSNGTVQEVSKDINVESLGKQAKEILNILHPDGTTTQESRNRINAISFKFQHPPVAKIEEARISGVPVAYWGPFKAELDGLLAQVKAEKNGVLVAAGNDDFGV